MGEETRDVGETSVLGEERQGAERSGGRELRHTGYYDIISPAPHAACRQQETDEIAGILGRLQSWGMTRDIR